MSLDIFQNSELSMHGFALQSHAGFGVFLFVLRCAKVSNEVYISDMNAA